jgi:ubiquinone/menaquinone biosynthesis C-methylase UbiE
MNRAQANRIWHNLHAGEYSVEHLPKEFCRRITIKKNASVLCLGVGKGEELSYLKIPSRDLTLLDISEEMLKLCPFKGKKIRDSAEHFLAKNKRKYDVIITSSFLHHLDRPYLMMSDIGKALKLNGEWILLHEPTTVHWTTYWGLNPNKSFRKNLEVFLFCHPKLRRALKLLLGKKTGFEEMQYLVESGLKTGTTPSEVANIGILWIDRINMEDTGVFSAVFKKRGKI